MPDGLKIVGYGRSKYSDEALREKVGAKLDVSDEEKESFLKTVRNLPCSLAAIAERLAL